MELERVIDWFILLVASWLFVFVVLAFMGLIHLVRKVFKLRRKKPLTRQQPITSSAYVQNE